MRRRIAEENVARETRKRKARVKDASKAARRFSGRAVVSLKEYPCRRFLATGCPPIMNYRSVALIALLLIAPLTRAQAADYDEMPVPVKSVAPEYPAAMKEERASGLVTVQVVIDENGDVAECAVAKSSHAEFEAPAVAAVGKWKFKPAKKGGVAVRAKLQIPIKFIAGA
jgi:protein TonB